MSTSYYMACEKCQECYWVGQDGTKFFTFYSGEPRCMKGIGDFLGKHVLCGGDGPRLMSEHRVEDFKEVEWPDSKEIEWATKAKEVTTAALSEEGKT